MKRDAERYLEAVDLAFARRIARPTVDQFGASLGWAEERCAQLTAYLMRQGIL